MGSHESHGSRISGQYSAVNAGLLRIAERELHHALTEQQRSMGEDMPAADVAFTRAVHVVCEEAHRLNLRAEELLIALKQAWTQLATTRARHLGDRDGDVLREIVTTSIEVFFEARTPNRERD